MSGALAWLDNAGTIVGGRGGASSSLTTTTNPDPVYSADGTTVSLLTVRETAPVGAAGNGGAGVAMGGSDNMLTNTGRIVGGAGGTNTGVIETATDVYSLPTYQFLGTTVTTAPSAAMGAPGAGGAGVVVDGQRNTLVNAGSIEGGLSTDGATRANAVLVSGNGNTVELRSGYSFVGNVVSTGAGNTLALGGAVNDSFDVSRVVTQLDGSAPVQYTGFERFLKKDASTWTLTGSTAALTPWTVAGGTLAISSDASLGAPGGTLTLDGGTLQATASIDSARPVIVGAAGGTWLTEAGTTSTLSGAIDGTGALVKTGSGRLNYTGVGTLSGPTTVADGRLAVNGSLASSAITVGSGATLAGNGTVGATLVVAGGTIAPGNSIGTLTVNGNFVQAAGSTYQVEVAPGSNVSDRIQVVGRATIDSGATLNVARTSNGNFALDTRYTVVSADGGVSGVYTLTGDTFAFVQLEDTYDANHVYLTAVQKRRFIDAGGTPNEVATAGALDLQPVRNPLTDALAWLPNDIAARHAFDQLSGELHASLKTGLLEDSRFVREASNDRLLGVFCAPGASDQVRRQPGARDSNDDACMPSADLTAWGRVFGSTGHMRGDGNAARLDRDIGGFFVGADAGLDGGWRVGALGGFSRSDLSVDARQSSAKADSYTLGVYGGNRWGATSLRLGASYTWHRFNTQRSVSIPGYVDALSAKYDASTAQVYGELGHRLDIGTQVAVEPFAGLAHVKVNTDRFAERGSFAALHGGGSRADATFGTLGARFTAQVSDSTRLRATLGWRHAFGTITPRSTHALVGGLPFTVSGVPLASNVAVVEAGVETLLKPGLKLSAAYNGQFGGGVRDNGVKIGLDWKF
jgi:outer membrane autotransporter protein